MNKQSPTVNEPGYAAAGHSRVSGLEAAIAKWQFFDENLYGSLNHDVRAGWSGPLVSHFVQHGLREGRNFLTPQHVAQVLASLVPSEGDWPQNQAEPLENRSAAQLDLVIYASSRGNFFMREIARKIADELSLLGARASVADENSAPEAAGRHSLVVAPHEFFRLGNGVNWQKPEFVERSVMLSTEQPHTTWFALSVPYLLSSAGIIELCWQSHETFRNAGFKSYFHIPGFPAQSARTNFKPDLSRTELIRTLPQEALDYRSETDHFSERPIDIAFLGTDSPLRDEFFTSGIATLARLKSFILYRRLNAGMPKPYGSDEEIDDINRYILSRTKIMINIHRDEIGYFEIHRMGMQGMWNGALVVTNRCLPHPVFKVGEHFLEETITQIPKLVEWLATTPDGRREGERVRRNAYSTYAEKLSSVAQSSRLATFLDRCFNGASES